MKIAMWAAWAGLKVTFILESTPEEGNLQPGAREEGRDLSSVETHSTTHLGGDNPGRSTCLAFWRDL